MNTIAAPSSGRTVSVSGTKAMGFQPYFDNVDLASLLAKKDSMALNLLPISLASIFIVLRKG